MLELDKSGNFWWLDGSVIEPYQITERWEEMVNALDDMNEKLYSKDMENAALQRRLAEAERLLSGFNERWLMETEPGLNPSNPVWKWCNDAAAFLSRAPSEWVMVRRTTATDALCTFLKVKEISSIIPIEAFNHGVQEELMQKLNGEIEELKAVLELKP